MIALALWLIVLVLFVWRLYGWRERRDRRAAVPRRRLYCDPRMPAGRRL